MDPVTAQSSEPPATLPIGQAPDLASFREAKSKGLTEIPNPAAKPSVALNPDEAPDDEVENNPDLRAEIDTLETPKDNETPAEKAARTKRHKEAARKGFVTRIQNKNQRLEQENRELRQRLDRPAPPASERRPADAAHRPASQAETITDPNDPEPTLESVTAKHPNDPDPYARLQRELAAWDRRQERRDAEAREQTRQAEQRATETRTRLEQQAESGRGVHRDYDAKLSALGQLLDGHPADVVIADALAGIDDPKVGGELLYQLASKLDDLKTAVRGGRASLIRFIGRLERDITAAAEKPAPVPISAAPAPHKPVAAASSASTSFDPTKPSGSVDEWRRHKAAGGVR